MEVCRGSGETLGGHQEVGCWQSGERSRVKTKFGEISIKLRWDDLAQGVVQVEKKTKRSPGDQQLEARQKKRNQQRTPKRSSQHGGRGLGGCGLRAVRQRTSIINSAKCCFWVQEDAG